MAFRITSRFGEISSIRDGRSHTGIDIAMPEGTELRSVVDGVVTDVFTGSGFIGKGVEIRGVDGKEYIYGHLSETSVNIGDEVKFAQFIGESGNTGNSTGPHLHFSVKENGQFIDPEGYASQLMSLSGDMDTSVVANGDEIPSFDMDSGSSVEVSGDTSWLGEKIGDGAEFLFSPVVEGIGRFFYEVATGIMSQLPMVGTLVGLLCFLLTIALSNHKPYFWGLGAWALSAIVRVINIEMGI